MFPLTFEWKKQGNMPYRTNFDNSCIIDEKVYISKYKSQGVLVYNPYTDTWVTLSTPTEEYEIVFLNGKLTLVGGYLLLNHGIEYIILRSSFWIMIHSSGQHLIHQSQWDGGKWAALLTYIT